MDFIRLQMYRLSPPPYSADRTELASCRRTRSSPDLVLQRIERWQLRYDQARTNAKHYIQNLQKTSIGPWPTNGSYLSELASVPRITSLNTFLNCLSHARTTTRAALPVRNKQRIRNAGTRACHHRVPRSGEYRFIIRFCRRFQSSTNHFLP